MSMRSVLVAIFCALCAAASAQWSAPALVWQDTTEFLEARMLITPGDTLRTAVMDAGWNGSAGWFRIRAGWSLGDSWSELEDVTGLDSLLGGYEGMGFGCDPQRRLWLGWYRGSGFTFQEDSWAVCTAQRDAGGWHPFEKSIVPFWSGGAESFAADGQGNWCMSVERFVLDSPGYYVDAMYSRLDRDTWTYPRLIAAGMMRPAQSEHRSIVLVPRPDSGLWEVDDWHEDMSSPRVFVHQVLQDTVISVLDTRGDWSEATADSAGRLWVVYVRDYAAQSMVISDGAVVDSQVVAQIADAQPFVCTDPAGWIWAVWSCGWSVRVSYNAGHGWSPAETVASFEAKPLGIVSDSRGRIYVLFVSRDGSRLLTSYRTDRPAVTEQVTPTISILQPPRTIVHGSLLLPEAFSGERSAVGACLLDAVGRKSMELRAGANDVSRLSPGVYFVRDARRQAQAQAVSKVVITR